VSQVPLTIAAAATALATGAVTSTELTRTMLERIAATNDSLGAYVTVCADTALDAAAAADKKLRSGRAASPLLGIPLAIKDIFATLDAPTSANSRAMCADWGRGLDAKVVAMLRARGAVMIGKATTNEFACGPPDPASGFPMPRNPWNVEHTADGSSSGTAIAVAAGLAFGGPGTDSGGSIRGPAAANGITGLKPSFGLVSRTGVIPLADSLDTVGPMARTAYDCAFLLDAMTDAEPACAAGLSERLNGTRVGLVRGYFLDSPHLSADARAAVLTVADALAAAGAVIRDVEVSGIETSVAANRVVVTYEAFAVHRENLEHRWDCYGDATRRFLSSGRTLTQDQYNEALRVQAEFRQTLAGLFDAVDALLLPGSIGPAVRIENYGSSVDQPDFDGPWNLIGLPAVTFPCAFTPSGLPLAAQIVGPAFDDVGVLRLAHTYQTGTDWHLREPLEHQDHIGRRFIGDR
jgi:aspartyl-tRNA(Asn)/glutamyl-tRNA(Gln) amidotransferase subunit A